MTIHLAWNESDVAAKGTKHGGGGVMDIAATGRGDGSLHRGETCTAGTASRGRVIGYEVCREHKARKRWRPTSSACEWDGRRCPRGEAERGRILSGRSARRIVRWCSSMTATAGDARTWPADRCCRWAVGVGLRVERCGGGRTTSGGRIVTDLRSFDGVPVEVELAVFRRYNLEKRA